MKKIMLMCCVLLMGCTEIRQFGIAAADEEVKNAEAIREISARLITAWPTISGLVRGAMDTDKFPVDIVLAMDELDELAEQTEWSHNDLGRIAGLRLKLCGEFFRQLIARIAPDLLIYLI
jgi:hypothetical protein